MLIASVSDFRKDINRYLDKVSKNFETLIINRGKDSDIVVMPLEEYNSLMATNMNYLPEQMNSVLTQQLKSSKWENRLKSSCRRDSYEVYFRNIQIKKS
jgi:antitoxin YefM